MPFKNLLAIKSYSMIVTDFFFVCLFCFVRFFVGFFVGFLHLQVTTILYTLLLEILLVFFRLLVIL